MSLPSLSPPYTARACKCSDKLGRNLVVCIDGTSKKFGVKSTNVVELCKHVTRNRSQLIYYISGVGTYAKPSWRSIKYLLQVFECKVDMAIAWNFEKIIFGAYRWLADNYEENDRIYFFGFSRGAYQVRTLAGMIKRIGLVYKGNIQQIPHAFEVYANQKRSRKDRHQPGDFLANRFRETFSRNNVQVHFVGVWDTVSSVGFGRQKNYPFTGSAEHICFFRHALALDERRVKFLPEYVHRGTSTENEDTEQFIPHIKEVWFPGTHGDIGGRNRGTNFDSDLGRVPLMWMLDQASISGLSIEHTAEEIPFLLAWRYSKPQNVKESLTWTWRLLEYLPVKRLSYERDSGSGTTRWPHRGRGRKVLRGQSVHVSATLEGYKPKAKCRGVAWKDLTTVQASDFSAQDIGNNWRGPGDSGTDQEDRDWENDWIEGYEETILVPHLEGDGFNPQTINHVIEQLKSPYLGSNAEYLCALRLREAVDEDGSREMMLTKPGVANDLLQIFSESRSLFTRTCVIDVLDDLLVMRGKGRLLGFREVRSHLEFDSIHYPVVCQFAARMSIQDSGFQSLAMRVLVHIIFRDVDVKWAVNDSEIQDLATMLSSNAELFGLPMLPQTARGLLETVQALRPADPSTEFQSHQGDGELEVTVAPKTDFLDSQDLGFIGKITRYVDQVASYCIV